MRSSDYTGVDVCTKAPEEVMSAAKREMSEKAASADSKGKRTADAAAVGGEEGEERAKDMKQSKLPGTSNKPLLRIQADNAISDYFDATATPHSAVDNVYFRTMLEIVQAAGPG